MATQLDPTAWGNAILEVGTPGAGDEMSSDMTQLGYALEETLSIEQEDGTVMELFEEGHILRDKLESEGTIIVSGTLIGIPAEVIEKFWKTTAGGTANAPTTQVKSTVSTEHWSVRLGTPAVIGSQRLNIPIASAKLGMAYSSTQGWSAPFTFTIIAGATGTLFFFDKVPAPEEP